MCENCLLRLIKKQLKQPKWQNFTQFSHTVRGKPFLMFVGKARSLPNSGSPERFSDRVGSCCTNRPQARLERRATDKHSSLLRTFINYGRKKFYNIAPGANVIKLHLSLIYGFSYQARVFVRQSKKILPRTNTLAQQKSS